MGIGHVAHRFDANFFRLHIPSNSAGIAMAGITKTLLAILLFLPIMSAAESEGQNYALGDCIMNTNPDHSWYKQEALVMDIVDSQLRGTTEYVLYFPHQKHSNAEIDQRRNDIGFFSIYFVNLSTVKVSDLACEERK
jgi:hypothetical protein